MSQRERKLIEKLKAVRAAQEHIAEARACLTAALALSLNGKNPKENQDAADGCIRVAVGLLKSGLPDPF